MINLNSWNGTGLVVNEPQFYPDKKLTKFMLSIGERYRGEDRTTVIQVKHFGEQFPVLNEHLKQGSRVAVTGPLQQETTSTEKGLRTVYIIYAQKVIIL